MGRVALAALTLLLGSYPVRALQQTSGSAPTAEAPILALFRNYETVTAERLTNPEPANWLQIRGNYAGWGYSELDQITPKNVSKLQLAWVFSTGAVNAHEAAPLVNNGVMYVSSPGNQVFAINAKTGTLLWRYRREIPPGAIVMHPVSRGVALFADKVFFASNAAVLVALDAKTGKEVWTATVEDNKKGYYMSGAPVIADGKVVVGVSGGEWGIRGFVAAYDLNTGKEVWRCFTIPAPGEPGSETWPNGDEWKTGGGPTWVSGNYDPNTNLLYWGVGNGGPWMGELRPGDNLYTSSTIAINAATGKIVGYHQYDPNESFDWDEVSPPLLIDFRRNGKTIKGLIDVARDGYVFFLERAGSAGSSACVGRQGDCDDRGIMRIHLAASGSIRAAAIFTQSKTTPAIRLWCLRTAPREIPNPCVSSRSRTARNRCALLRRPRRSRGPAC